MRRRFIPWWYGPSGAPPFSPSQLPNLQLWGNPSSTGVVFQDSGPNAITASTAAGTPTYNASSANLNAQPSAGFNGSSGVSFANVAAIQIVGPITVSAVIYVATMTSFCCVAAKGTSGTTCEFDIFSQMSSTTSATRRGGSIDQIVSTASSLITGANKYIITYTDPGTGTANAGALYINGTAVSYTQSSNGTASTTTSALFVGRRSDGTTVLNGEMGSLVVCSSVLSSTNLTNLHRYWGAQYGISVP